MRALIVAYSFPPVGGAGVQRVLKLVKYLPEHGITPTVLSVENPSVPVLDRSLERELPPGLRVIRTRTLEPGYGAKQAAWSAKGEEGARRNSWRKRVTQAGVAAAKELLVPDPQILWQPTAQLALLRHLAERERPDVLMISGPPFSQFLLAPLARLRKGTGIIFDYRDEWSTYRTTYEMMGSRLGRLIGDPMEAALLRLAHVVTTATAEFRENLLAHFSWMPPTKVVAISNGYDPSDFPEDLPSPENDKLTITYAGTLFKLTSVRGFLGAVRRLHEHEPALAKLLRVRFIGRIVETELPFFAGTEALGVERIGYMEHTHVLEELGRSHLVLCTLDEVPGVERIYPAKIFELMYLGRPILTLAPPGALTRLVEAHQLGVVLSPRDEAAIAEHLAERLRAFARGERESQSQAIGIERYARRALAGEFAEWMREANWRAQR